MKKIIKPCPWCGTTPQWNYWRNEGYGVLICCGQDCHVTPSVEADTKENAIIIWNNRNNKRNTEKVGICA